MAKEKKETELLLFNRLETSFSDRFDINAIKHGSGAFGRTQSSIKCGAFTGK